MKRILFALSLGYASLGSAQGAPPPVPSQAAVPHTPATFVAQGEAVEIPDAGFTITPPIGWEVIRNGSGASLLFQGPKPAETPGVTTYQPNIRVMMFNEPRPMDDSTKEEFNKIILDRNSSISNRVSGYNIRSAEKVQLANGIDAYLYYAEFTFDSTPTMQMHILVSSGTKHFLMTYTDLSSVFEKEGSPGLTTAYTAMQGIKLDSLPPDRFTKMYIGGGAAGLLILLLMTVKFVRGYRMKKLGERIESEDGSESTRDSDSDSDDDDFESTSAIAELDDHDGGHDEDYDMPETREAPRSEVVAKVKVKAPAAKPAPVVKPKPEVVAKAPAPTPLPKPAPVAPKPAAPVAPKPVAPVAAKPAAPEPQKFEARTRKETPISEMGSMSAPISEIPVSIAAPLSDAWNLNEGSSRDIEEDEEPEVSGVSEIIAKPVVTSAAKAKHQKTTPPVRTKAKEPDEDTSQVARLSEILPNTGDAKKKKKGFFGWGKGKKEEDDSFDMPAIDDLEDGELHSKSSKKEKDKPKTVVQAKSSTNTQAQPSSQVSAIAGDSWNLNEGHAHHDEDAEDEED